jgi:AraC family transcriptional regulator of adaptative response/methylated-DNA-[protein]-cysteine methyltransferase
MSDSMPHLSTSADNAARPLSSFANDDERWDAVRRRDHAAIGAFVYSVRTTGVYCRPACGARQPRRKNVEFHRSGADAERVGFRPCKRCRPSDRQVAT